jgi:hypothetical protein
MPHHVRPPRKRIALLASIPVALIASGAMVWQASYSAFTAKDSTPVNNWAAGTVALSDDDANAAMFTASNLKPGSTGQKCIVVTSNGSLPSAVKLYGTSYTTTNALALNITVTVDEGTGGTFAGGCAGFTSSTQIFNGTLANFGSSKTSYANGVGAWTTAGTSGETKVYRVAYTVSPSTPDSAQGGTAGVLFTWEAQNA